METIYIHVYNAEKALFEPYNDTPITVNGNITNIIVNDFNMDNYYDLLVEYFDSENLIYKVTLFVKKNDTSGFTLHNIFSSTSQAKAQIMIGDLNGDSK